MTKKPMEFASVIPAIIDSVRYASAMAAHDISFYRTMDKEIDTIAAESSEMLLEMLRNLTTSKDLSDTSNLMINSQAFWDNFESKLDTIYEKVDVAMEKYDITHKKNTKIAAISMGPLEKPQVHFAEDIDNSDTKPFKPKLRSKPFCLRLLEDLLVTDTEGRYEHPYQHEIMTQPYPDWILDKCLPEEPQDWDSQPATFVSTVTQLNDMVKKLKSSKSIAVDLEHHDLRTYYGLTCLMQISDRDQDWLIDVLALRSDMVILNEIFANPNIVKVFHGAFMDIIWLQRDLGLYVVSLFDTYHAAKLLGYPKRSLAYLLEKFAGFKASKKYQLADWRLRPLPDAMSHYARADTHFLLNIFDHLRNSLVDEKEEKLQQVLFASRKVALRKFEFIKFSEELGKVDESSTIMTNYNVPIHLENRLRLLVGWRDKTARSMDESTRYIMPNSTLVQLAASDVPTDNSSIAAIRSVNVTGFQLESLVNFMNENFENSSTESTNNNFKISQQTEDTSADSLHIVLQNQRQLLPQVASGVCGTSSLFTESLLGSEILHPRLNKKDTKLLQLLPLLWSSFTSAANNPPAMSDREQQGDRELSPEREALQSEETVLDAQNIRGFKVGKQEYSTTKREGASSTNIVNYEEALQAQNTEETKKRKRSVQQFDPHSHNGKKAQYGAPRKRRQFQGKSAAFTK
ncbi:hypothetical protein C7M61_003706 [Candidozyma pseudohaemuli]|uniref:3'-5' exonuclease domain-containing protein n=1 Tax=Candidozyma pseudohaemuli TaxID=418784 RepID=A0A2P7YLL7_9ASCO|nr:hypothetical protein C7M61_003706 [[Candida] pseudohaemulonii]PSK36842.1 hypothetical protein C7M61_003706 [[Candida] pseudohaemulonii]